MTSTNEVGGLDRVAVRQIGDAEIAVVSAGEMHGIEPRADRSPYGGFEHGDAWIVPGTDVDDQGRGIFGINWLVVRLGGATVVVDPSTPPEDREDHGVRLVGGCGVDDALAALGLRGEDVTHVVISHLHDDHLTGVLGPDRTPRFPNAEHVFGAADWEALQAGEPIAGALASLEHLAPVDGAGLLTTFTGDREIVPGVHALAAPGESEGHCVVRVGDGEDRAYYLADLVHFPVEFEHIDWIAMRGRDGAAMNASRRRILAEAEGRPSLFTHGRFPAWGSVRRGGDAWTWSYA